MCKILCYPFINVVCYSMRYIVAVSQDFGPTFPVCALIMRTLKAMVHVVKLFNHGCI